MNFDHAARSTLFGAGVALCATVSIFIRSSVASEPEAMMPASSALQYVRLYTDPNGVSQFADETFELRSGNDLGQGSLAAYPIPNVESASYVALKSGVVADWHTAPRRQFIICLTGEAEFIAGSGAVRNLKPGDVILVEDTTGKGHITRSIGREDHIAMVVPVPTALR
jgi:quercetin dioxygenase-like cupin family protein